MVKFVSREIILSRHEPTPLWEFADGFDLRKVTKPGRGAVIAEFIGTGDFASQWNERRRYEVDAGRENEPLLYESIYNIVVDPNLPQIVPVYRLGPGGVVFEEINEGGEVKFVTVGQSNYSIPIRHWAVGLQYSKDLRIYNQLWNVGIVERQAGVAYNALLNHLHLSPILTATYGAGNQTDGTALTTFKASASMAEKYLRAVEAAIEASRTDSTNPRRGPYDLLISSSDAFTMERALNRVPQQGFDLQSSAINLIQNVIVYDGWTGSRGKKSTTYAGVTSGKAYLISKGYRETDFQSMVKQSLDMAMGNPDVSRFIEEKTVWDTYLGVYANPSAAVQEITLPTAGSGAA
ncbi:MAG: hypothetical protein D6698_16350 [Gammaproteobacteria bacterium]|nr:MAG: hypothetical protein D6698_16350 [Gammaproteobacteria bacterium]